MATSFKKTVVRNYGKVGEKVTTDTIYWKKLQTPVIKKEYGAITHIDFSPVSPHQLAVTNSTRVQIYSPSSLHIYRTLSKFKENAYCGSFRSDGRLMVAGGDEGIIRLFDITGRTILRVFKGHKGAVRVSKFLSSNTQVLSGSDDNTVKVWDVPTEKETVTYTDHTDYVRCGVTSKSSNDIVLTGSYDHTVKLFDARIGECVMSVDHGAPVESVLMFPTGGLFFSAGGKTVKVWDALAGGKLVTTLCNHHNTVTCLSFSSNYQRLLSGGLDRHVKIYDVGSYQVVHTLDFTGSILSLGVSPDDSLVAVGTAEGLLSLQRRKQDEEVAQKKTKKKPVSFRYGLRGKTIIPNKDDYVIEHRKKEQLAKYDKYFKHFEHSKALNAVLEQKIRRNSPEVTIAVMQELIRRGAIKGALAGREGSSLRTLIIFIQRNISNPRFTSTLIDVANLVLDIYYPEIGKSAVLDTELHKLRETVEHEEVYMKKLLEVIGQLDTLFSASQQFQMASDTSTLSVTDTSTLGTNNTVLEPSTSAKVS